MVATTAPVSEAIIRVEGDLDIKESGPGSVRVVAKAGTPGRVSGGKRELRVPTRRAEITVEGDVEIVEEGPGSVEILSKAGDESRIRVG